MMKLDYQSERDRSPTESEENLGGSLSSEEEEEKRLDSNKVRMKLKGSSPKPNGGGDWVCRRCGKEFRSSKALGGHMRVHMEEQRAAKGTVSASGVEDGPPTCTLCNKTFRSRKSLFGHMRCHPERKWRGMQPPLKATITGGTDQATWTGLTDPVRLEPPLRVRVGEWSAAKSQRGRSTDRQTSLKHDDEQLLEGVYALLLLSTGKDCYKINPKNADVDVDGDNKYFNPPSLGIRGCDDNQLHNCAYEMAAKLTEDSMETDDHNPIYLSINLQNKKKRKSYSAHQTERSYSCSICNKSFPSPQALGGHTSSAHNKLLIRNMGGQELLAQGDDCAKEDCGVSRASTTDVVLAAAHICRICEKAFPSGQALGGHKRCHYWQGSTDAGQAEADQGVACLPPPSPAAEKQLQIMCCDDHSSPATPTRRELSGFDLNEIPSDDFEVSGRIL